VAKKTDTPAQDTARDPNGPNPIAPPSGDIALVFGKGADGVHILRRRSEEAPIEAGLLRPMREGKPIRGEVVSLTQRQDLPMFYDVKSEFGAPVESDTGIPGARMPGARMPGARMPGARMPGDGPAQVASDAYRRGWDAVWGRGRDRSIN
jgi:hypothetical protein